MARVSPSSPTRTQAVVAVHSLFDPAEFDETSEGPPMRRKLEFGNVSLTWEAPFRAELSSEEEKSADIAGSEERISGEPEDPQSRAAEDSAKGKEREPFESSSAKSSREHEGSAPSEAKRKTPARSRRAAERRVRFLESGHARRQGPEPAKTSQTRLAAELSDQNDKADDEQPASKALGELSCCQRPWNIIQSLKAIVPVATVTALSFGAKAYVEKAVTETCLENGVSNDQANQLGLVAGGIYVSLSHTFASHLAPAIWNNILRLPGYASTAKDEAEKQWQDAWTYTVPILTFFTLAYIPRGAMMEGSKDLAEIAASKCCASMGAAVATGFTVDALRQTFTEALYLKRVEPRSRSWENFTGNAKAQMTKMVDQFAGPGSARKWLRDIVFKLPFTVAGNVLAGEIWPQSFGVAGAEGEGALAGGVSMFSFLAGGFLGPGQGGAALGALIDGRLRVASAQADVESARAPDG